MPNEFPTSYDTALCLIPPRSQWASIDSLRYHHDEAYPEWPPHITLVFPFVSRSCLESAAELIGTQLARSPQPLSVLPDLQISLDSIGTAVYGSSIAFFTQDGDPVRAAWLQHIQSAVLETIGSSNADESACQIRLTVGQTDRAVGLDTHRCCMDELALMPAISWRPSHLTVLQRGPDGRMASWASIDLATGNVKRASGTPYYELPQDTLLSGRRSAKVFSQARAIWTEPGLASPKVASLELPDHLVLASYNVQAEIDCPRSRERHPLLIENILEANALADILILQEATDDFLALLLSSPSIRQHYPFVSHDPSSQIHASPLTQHPKTVVLSKYCFSWYPLLTDSRSEAMCVVTFENLKLKNGSGDSVALVLGCIHLMPGLTDAATSEREEEIRHILGHMAGNYSDCAWILAGDFNIQSSLATIDRTQKQGHIHSMESMITESGLIDAWTMARLEVGESSDDMKTSLMAQDLFEGEQGATFDPGADHAVTLSLAGSSDARPQRYDRIFVRPMGVVRPARFNMFGFTSSETTSVNGKPLRASGHWGIRCLLSTDVGNHSVHSVAHQQRVVPVVLRRAPATISASQTIVKFLEANPNIPTAAHESSHADALAALEQFVLGCCPNKPLGSIKGRVFNVVEAVGSFALGVWTKDSNLECTCIGSMRPDTFFRIAKQRLRRATGTAIRLLRTVKASFGKMMELEIHGIRTDLRYCQAARIAEAWPRVMNRPPTDAAFSLGPEALLQLKSARDTTYLRHSIPDLAQFRIAHRLLKIWAKERGIYGPNFGYLGDVQITAMLVPVCKMLRQTDGGQISAADVVTTFFSHYADFPWDSEIVFDPFFHHDLVYRRTSREHLCLLGWHAPALNTASTIPRSSVNTITAEIARACKLVSSPLATWGQVINGSLDQDHDKETPSLGAVDFLEAYLHFVKITVHYWGQSRHVGSRFLGWVESRCISLLVDMDLKVEGFVPRIWPQRFVLGSQRDEHGHQLVDDRTYEGFYLLGLDRDESRLGRGMHTTTSDLKAVLNAFEQSIVTDKRHYDPDTSWFNASIAKAAEVEGACVDVRDWGQHSDSDQTDDSDDETDDEQLAVESASRNTDRVLTNRPAGAGRFRTALDVLNRLRWDPAMDKTDYLVGYLDRFDGIQEKAVSVWKTDQTDDEFIPQHRIMHFRKRSSGHIVWERSTWTDNVFGSGL